MKTVEQYIKALEECQGVNLVSDAAGKWAVSDAGFQPVPEGDGFNETVSIVSYVDPEDWKPSILEALASYFDLLEDGE